MRDVRSTLYLLWGGVVFVLLVGAVNVTNLMLVRSSARMKELATRHALGAGLARIARQLLTETHAAGGWPAARSASALGYGGRARAHRVRASTRRRRARTVAIDATVVAFTLGLALALDAAHRAHSGPRACGT